MMRSLYAGVSGLRAHQTRMDVIGNNIANVNTVGFKSSRVTFKDVFYQTMATATNPNDEDGYGRGGTNPYQIGIGTMISTIDTLNTRAGYQTTDKPWDVYIDGEGYFRVSNTMTSEDEGHISYYTRVGNFTFDALGRLVDGYGNFVYGQGDQVVAIQDLARDSFFETAEPDGEYEPEATNVINIEDFLRYTQIQIGPDGVITAIDKSGEGDEGELVAIGQIALYKFINNDALLQVGTTYLMETANSGQPRLCIPGDGGTGKLQTGGLEMSNVDLSKEFTDMIITQRGFQANSRIITVSDEMLQELVNLKR